MYLVGASHPHKTNAQSKDRPLFRDPKHGVGLTGSKKHLLL
jgi:hypothetical protein